MVIYIGFSNFAWFLWLIYGYVARPTNEQLEQLGEKIQQRIVMARGQLTNLPSRNATEVTHDSTVHHQDVDTQNPTTSIKEFLSAFAMTRLSLSLVTESSAPINTSVQPPVTHAFTDSIQQQDIKIQIHFMTNTTY